MHPAGRGDGAASHINTPGRTVARSNRSRINRDRIRKPLGNILSM
jgi:hypothetical protein